MAQRIVIPHVYDPTSSRHRPEAHGTYITEQQIDEYLIANLKDDEGKMENIIAEQQKYEAILKMVKEANAKEGFYHEGTRTLPKPVPVRTLPEGHDWEFFYSSLQATPQQCPAAGRQY